VFLLAGFHLTTILPHDFFEILNFIGSAIIPATIPVRTSPACSFSKHARGVRTDY
jgi:hypothetical protein